ncbi:hypothetical protein J2S74_001580 [Evansella vedderi]|uniref:YhzD-like protein n=1 Tax=Evansella vedderi TaxID=38282 RepID=A0ABT9ZSJ4_9BACI|nr:YhzD family protein [Evansella vedderi]MDQ0254205.1 hypothetical protein [Evansella vedderi]
MGKYFVTAFNADGSVLLNESFHAKDDQDAKHKGLKRLKEEKIEINTSRIVRSSAGLIYFKP